MRIVTLCLLASIALPGVAADLPQAGLYKISAQVASQQMPIGRTHESQECIKDDRFLENPESFMRNQPGQECQVVNYDLSNGAIQMQMLCTMPGGGQATINGSGTYHGSGFELNNQMNVNANGMQMEVNTTVTGTRQSSC